MPDLGKRLNPTDLKSIEALLQSCKWIETCNEVSSNNQNFHSQPSTSQYFRSIPPFKCKPIYTINAISSLPPTRFTCPRCRNNKHTLTNCTNVEVVCFRCGKKGYTSLNTTTIIRFQKN